MVFGTFRKAIFGDNSKSEHDSRKERTTHHIDVGKQGAAAQEWYAINKPKSALAKPIVDCTEAGPRGLRHTTVDRPPPSLHAIEHYQHVSGQEGNEEVQTTADARNNRRAVVTALASSPQAHRNDIIRAAVEKEREKLKLKHEEELGKQIDETNKWKAEVSMSKEQVAKWKESSQSAEKRHAELEVEFNNLGAEYRKQHAEYKGQKDILRTVLRDLHEQRTKYTHDREEWEGQLSKCQAQIGKLEEEKADYQSQLDKMSQIVSKLSKRGLPLAPDDSYFINALDSVVSELRQWARLFVRGKTALRAEDEVWGSLPEQTQIHLKEAFTDLRGLLESPKVGNKVRTRCVEVILCRSLISTYLYDYLIGLAKQDKDAIEWLCNSQINVSDEEARQWKALTLFLYTKNKEVFHNRKEEAIDFVTEAVYAQISPFGELGRAKLETLREIITKIAGLGWEIQQLPFYIAPMPFTPDGLFTDVLMEDVEWDDDDEEEEKDPRRKTTIIITPAWVKLEYNDEGKTELGATKYGVLLTKAKVSCLR